MTNNLSDILNIKMCKSSKLNNTFWKRFISGLEAKNLTVGFIDTETSLAHLVGFHVGRDMSMTHEQIISPSKVMMIQYQRFGKIQDKSPVVNVWNQKEKCDKDLLLKTIPILNSCDVLIAQNGDSFDMKTLQWRLCVHQLPSLTNALTLDTLKLSRGSFRAMSHKLDYRAKVHGTTGKIPMRMGNWIDILFDVPGSLEKMIKYARNDIPLLITTFKREMPYYRNLPVWFKKLLTDGSKTTSICPICCSTSTSNGWRAGQQRMVCKNGHWWKR